MENSKQVIFKAILALVAVATLAWQPSATLPRAADQPSLRGAARSSATSLPPRLKEIYGRLPLAFEANEGQTDSRVQFLSRGNGYTLFLTGNQAVLTLAKADANVEPRHPAATASGTNRERSATLRMTLLGANSASKVVGVEELPGKTNYFIGNNPKKWRTNVATYAKVKYNDVYPGVDLVYYGNQGGQLEFDFVVAPGADPKAIQLAVGAMSPSPNGGQRPKPQIDAHGDLVMQAKGGEISFRKPVVYQQDNDGHRWGIDGGYLLSTAQSKTKNPKTRISFEVASYDHSRPLVIDPAIAYSSLLGGTSGQSYASGVAVFTDPVTGHDYAYVSGVTCASDFLTVNPEQPTFGGGYNPYVGCDGFVTKFDPSASGTASVVYSTFLGGSEPDGATGIVVDSNGDAYVVGLTGSTDFPTMNAFQGAIRSGQNAFLAKLSADGSTLLFSTYFGGSGSDAANAIALDSAGRAYIAGWTSSSDLPTLNGFQSSLPSNVSAFVAVFDTTRAGASSLLYSTYLGGAQNGPGDGDRAYAIAVDSNGAIHVGGFTSSPSFPTVGAFQPQLPTGSIAAAFYAKLNTSLSGSAQLVYSTFLGGSDPYSGSHRDTVNGIAVDSAGNAYLTGTSYSDVFPVTAGAFQTVRAGSAAYPTPFVTKINPSLAGSASLIYSTFLSGPSQDGDNRGAGVAVDANGDAFVVGTLGPGLPLVNPVMGSQNGVLQSLDAGTNWTGLTQGLTEFPIAALAVDASTSPRTLYAASYGGEFATDAGVFASTDGGLNWTEVFHLSSPATPGSCNNGSDGPCIFALAIDPTTPSNVYAGTNEGVFKSPDRGATWNAFNAGLSSTALQGIRALVFDGGTLYAGAGDGLYVLSPGATSWTSTSLGVDVHNIAVDNTTSPHTLYTASEESAAYESTDGAATWTAIGDPGDCGPFSSIAVDTGTSPSTLYAYESCDPYLEKSTDGGSNWTVLGLQYLSAQDNAVTIALDRAQVPSTLYVRDIANGVFKSTDGGYTWSDVLPAPMGAMALDATTAGPSTPPTIYSATSYPAPGAFVAELNPSGSRLPFSTYLGGIASNAGGTGIALDASDNIYVAGSTSNPAYFPTVNGYQPIAANLLWPSGFFTELGSQLLPESSSGSLTTQVGTGTGTLSVTFPNISGSTTSTQPTLTVTPLSSTTTANFYLSDNLGAYDISTTAVYSGTVTLCFQALTVNDLATFDGLQILHVVNGTPVNIASSYDFSTRTICGTTTSFSPFVLVKSAVDQAYDLIREVSECDLRHGIDTSLDAKLQNAIGALGSASQNDATTAINILNAFISSVEAQSGQAITTTEAANLIAAARQIQATLGFVPSGT
jgi:Beta-propeller repeat